MARPVRQGAVHLPGALQSAQQEDLAGRQRARLRLRPQARPHQQRRGGDDQLCGAQGAAGGLALCGRDEEIDVQRAQLPAAGKGRAAHALLRQHGRGWRRLPVFRLVRHRQDHPVGGPGPLSDRRRRARLGQGHGVQLRGRLLRQVHRPKPRERAGHLRRHQLWRHRRKRGHGRGQPGDRLRRLDAHRKHPGLLPARQHRTQGAGEPGRRAGQRHFPDLRRERRAAAGVDPVQGGGRLPFPVGLHRRRRLHRGRLLGGVQGNLLHLLRRRLLSAPGGGLRGLAHSPGGGVRLPSVPSQHRLDRGRLRGRPPLSHTGHPRHHRRRAERRPCERRDRVSRQPQPDHSQGP